MNNIPNISFKSNKEGTDIEILNLTELFSRIDKTPTHNPRQSHRLTFFAILIILEGSGSHQIDLKKYTLKQGTVLKIAKGQIHAFQENLSYKGFLIVFTEDYVLKYFSKSSIDFISHLYNYHISEPLVENCTFNEFFLEQVTNGLNKENTPAQKNIIAKILELYLLKLEQLSLTSVSVKLPKDYYPLFLQFKNLVERKYSDTRNVKDYANIMAISTGLLNKVIQNITLNTAKFFIDQYVILEIKRTIISTNKALKEISYQMGFDEVTNFTKFFKKHTNITPKEYQSGL